MSPKERSPHASTRLYANTNIHRLGWEYLCEDMVAAEKRNPEWKNETMRHLEWKNETMRHLEGVAETMDLNWRVDGRVDVHLENKPMYTKHHLSSEMQTFWPTFSWINNPWIATVTGEQYSLPRYKFLGECTIAQLNLRREDETDFSVKLPVLRATLTYRRLVLLKGLLASIILCSPELAIGADATLQRDQIVWGNTTLKGDYRWISNGMGTMLGVPRDQQKKEEYIQMQLQSNGVRWVITDWEGDTQCEHDVNLIREATKQTGWTFVPHPSTAISPWQVHPGTEPRSVAKVIDNQRTLRIYAPMRRGLDGIIDKLQRIAESDDWLEHVQFRQSTDIWNQKDYITKWNLIPNSILMVPNGWWPKEWKL